MLTWGAPDISSSSEEERREYIKEKYHCINDCDMCGICKIFHNQDPELAMKDYIDGKRDYLDMMKDYR